MKRRDVTRLRQLFACGRQLTWGQVGVAMKTLLIASVAVLLLVGGIMNKACKTHHHAWCAPLFFAAPHAKTGHTRSIAVPLIVEPG